MIVILMSTYNGEKYLTEQLNSILQQTYTDWQLWIRDDGSQDATVAMLQDFAAQDTRIHLLPNDSMNLRAMKSFETLLQTAPQAEYYMFADQDDYWLPAKIEHTLHAMQEQENQHGSQTPIIVHTDLQVVDQNLHEIAPSFWQYSNIHPEILDNNPHYLGICNSVTGCTMLFNEAVRRLSCPFPQNIYMHDAWIALVVAQSRGVVFPLDEATMKYRQHTKNVVGAESYRFTLMHWQHKMWLAKRSYMTAHPLVFHNPLHFLYWKIRYFFTLHCL